VFLPHQVAQWLAAAGGALTVAATAYGLAMAWAHRGLAAAVRDPMTFVGAGLAFIVTGEVLHAAGAAFPSRADAISLAAYPILLIGLLRLTRTRVREHPLDTLLVAAIVPTTLGAVGWFPLLEALGRWIPEARGQAWVTVAFLAVDGLAVAIVGRLALLFRGKPVGYQLLLGAFAALLGAHLSRAAASVTGVVPAPFGSQTLLLVGFGLVGAATLHPSSRQTLRWRARPAPIGPGYLLLMTTAVLVGPALAIWRYAHLGGWAVPAVAAPGVVSLLVVAHLSRMLTERSRLEHASTHDALTGLPNRSFFHDQVALAVARADGAAPVAVGFLDLDRFKKVNDSLGHDAGDELLRQVADRLCAATRSEDIVARLAGDEFALLLPGADQEVATQVARRVLDSFAGPFRVSSRSLFTTPSIGLAVHPEHGADPETLLRHADAAMYRAKTVGRNTVQTYDDRLGGRADQELAVETALHSAIDRGELALHYQPKVHTATGAVTGVEALVRWQHPTLGTIPPSAFIRLAEETGLIAALGEWVLTTACRQAAAWRAAGRHIAVSVNLSARQFQLHHLPDLVGQALQTSGLPGQLLELELTESISLNEQETVTATLETLRGLGVRCSIDDFGTGYSGLGYLNSYPIDTIKLDRSLVAAIDDGDAPIVRAAIAMAHSLGLKVVAEGVETREQAAFLHTHGCDELQGYLISRPVPAEQLASLLDNTHRYPAVPPAQRPPRRLTPQPGASSTVWTEHALGELLLQQAEADSAAAEGLANSTGGEPRTPGGEVKRTLLLTGAATGILTLPMLLGLGAANALPPSAQHAVTTALDQMNATVPQPATRQQVEASQPTKPAKKKAARTGSTRPSSGGKQKPGQAKKPDGSKPQGKKPTAKQPVSKQPVSKQPVSKQPVSKQPVSKQPVSKQPVSKQPVPKTPVPKTPVPKTPVPKTPVGGQGGGDNRTTKPITTAVPRVTARP